MEASSLRKLFGATVLNGNYSEQNSDLVIAAVGRNGRRLTFNCFNSKAERASAWMYVLSAAVMAAFAMTLHEHGWHNPSHWLIDCICGLRPGTERCHGLLFSQLGNLIAAQERQQYNRYEYSLFHDAIRTNNAHYDQGQSKKLFTDIVYLLEEIIYSKIFVFRLPELKSWVTLEGRGSDSWIACKVGRYLSVCSQLKIKCRSLAVTAITALNGAQHRPLKPGPFHLNCVTTATH